MVGKAMMPYISMQDAPLDNAGHTGTHMGASMSNMPGPDSQATPLVLEQQQQPQLTQQQQQQPMQQPMQQLGAGWRSDMSGVTGGTEQWKWAGTSKQFQPTRAPLAARDPSSDNAASQAACVN